MELALDTGIKGLCSCCPCCLSECLTEALRGTDSLRDKSDQQGIWKGEQVWSPREAGDDRSQVGRMLGWEAMLLSPTYGFVSSALTPAELGLFPPGPLTHRCSEAQAETVPTTGHPPSPPSTPSDWIALSLYNSVYIAISFYSFCQMVSSFLL